MPRLLQVLGIAAGAITTFWWLVPMTDRGHSSPVGWLTFAVIRPTIPAWTGAASC